MKYVAYYRVSTKQQGASGLGLLAQETAVLKYTGVHGVFASFTDIESGRNDLRTELAKAIALCKKENATLVIARLDRLSRNVTFISQLMDNKVEFVCCDMPSANAFTIHIFAALAQQESDLVSQRTRAGLQEARKTKTLGNPQCLTNEGRAKGVLAIKAKAQANENNIKARAFAHAHEGKKRSVICTLLNKYGFKTSTGKTFSISQVTQLLKS